MLSIAVLQLTWVTPCQCQFISVLLLHVPAVLLSQRERVSEILLNIA
jgi:hypothetical protein